MQVEPAPAFFPPEVIQAEPLVELEYVAPEPPVGAEAPPAPAIGKPQYGHDWTGERPFTVRCFMGFGMKFEIYCNSKGQEPSDT